MTDRTRAMLITLVYFLFVVLIMTMKDVAFVLILVFISVAILNAVETFARKYFRSRIASTVFSLGIYFLFLAIALWLIIPAVVREFGSFYNTMMSKTNLEDWREFFGNEKIFEFFQKVVDYVRPKVDEYVNTMVGTLAASIPNFAMQLLFIILGTIYSLVYIDHLRSLPKVLYPDRLHAIAVPFMRELFSNLLRFVQAVFLTATMTGILFFLVFEVMDLKYSVTVGVWAFLTNFLPIVGVLFEYIPVFLFSLSLGFKGVIIMAVVTLVIHTAAFVTFLHMMRGYTRISPLEMLFFILLLWKVYGFTGIFVAVPLSIFVNVFWKHFIKPHFEEEKI